VIGYYSLRYGMGGVEAAFDEVLRGTRDMLDEIAHRPQVGGDVRLTLDLSLQEVTTAAVGRNAGAVVVVEVPTGEVRALYSSPSFSPGSLDTTYDLLRLNPFAPLLNRVTQGVYQPGGALQTIILAAMLAEQAPLSMTFENAAQPLVINNLTLRCAMPTQAVTLLDSYGAGCPAPFVGAAMANAARVQAMITAFGLLEAPTLVRFGTVTGKSPTPLDAIQNNDRLRAAAAGQGELIVTPLQMALVAATIANDGNTITPFMVDAIRPASSSAWQPQERSAEQQAVITQETAAQIRQAMRSAVTDGAAQAANALDIEIYGHASTAYTGLTANSWFIGFTMLPGGRAVVVAVVIEGRDDVTIPARIGGTVLRAAVQ
jgi:peptidoglycan glycosyltransferase